MEQKKFIKISLKMSHKHLLVKKGENLKER